MGIHNLLSIANKHGFTVEENSVCFLKARTNDSSKSYVVK